MLLLPLYLHKPHRVTSRVLLSHRKICEKFAVSFIIFAITAFVPILLDIHISINQLLVTPRNATSLRAFLTMKKFEIPRGLTSPINIMVGARLSDTNFRSMPCSDDDIDFKIEADNHYIGEYLQSCSDV